MMDGKAMNNCMSRRIAVDLYNALIALRPDLARAKDDDDAVEAVCDHRAAEDSDAHRAPLQARNCVVKVVMTGSAADAPDWQPHIRSKGKRRKQGIRFRDRRQRLSQLSGGG